MIIISTLPFAAIVGLVAFLQANDGGRKYFLASLGLMLASWGFSAFADPNWLQNGQVSVLLEWMYGLSVFLLLGIGFGHIGKRHWPAGKTGGIAGFATMALLWVWTWIG